MIFIAELHAQQYNFRPFSVDDGLSQSQVQCIAQDGDGFLWVGTAGGGLNRFDGKNFVNYTTYEGMPDDMIWSVFNDSQDRLWIGTGNGLAMMYNGNIKLFPSYHGLDDDEIWTITEDQKKQIWIGTATSGISVYDGKNFTNYGIKDGLGFSNVNRIHCDKKGNVWIGSYGYGITLFANNKFVQYNSARGFDGEYIYDITEDAKGNILFCTDKGLIQYNGVTFVHLDVPAFDYSNITDAYYDNNGYLWIATKSIGIIKIRGAEITHYSQDNGLISDYVNCITSDDYGNIWIGFDGSGFCKFHGETFLTYNKKSGLNSDIVKAIVKDKKGIYWIGTDKGINIIERNQVLSTGEDEFVKKSNCLSLYEDSRGYIWAGFNGALGYFDENRNFNRIKNIPADLSVYCFYEGENRQMWLGTDRGIYTVKGQGVVHRLKDSIPQTRIFSLRKSKFFPNAFWICSDAGLVMYDGEYIRSLPVKELKENLDVVDIWEDELKKKWIITNKGLLLLEDNNRKKFISKNDGLISNNLYTIFYFKNSLWIGSDKGIDRLFLDEKLNIKRILHYGKSQGFFGVETNTNAVAVSPEQFSIGTINGVYIYKSQSDNIKLQPPVCIISEVSLFYKKVNWEKEFPDLDIKKNLPQALKLNYNQNYITFTYTAIDFNHPDNITYQIFLEGLDTAWNYANKEKLATYSNLGHGEYVFKVRASDDGKNWGEPAQFKFKISAPFWKQSWFYFVVSPLLIFFLLIFTYWRTRILRKAKRRLEEKVQERTQELNLKNEELEKLSIVASQTNDGVLICDRTGKILYVNDGFIRMSGYNVEEFRQSDFNKMYLQEISSRQDIDKLLEQMHENHAPISYESTHRMKEGKIMWTRASLTPIYDQVHGLDKIIVIYTDITDRVITEQALLQSNKDITDSIQYARRIQEAILPSPGILTNNFTDSFLLYQPRDIVCGDFYWFARIKNYFVVACADCTGHGVPGAMMTMIGNEFLHQIINNSMVTGPDMALYLLDKQITRALHQEGLEREARDGMDIALCSINLDNLFCQFAGANIPMYLQRDGELVDFDAVKESIGGYKEKGKQFVAHEMNLKKGDIIYFTTDGFIDQFGGAHGKKFMRKRFRELLGAIRDLPMEEQKKILVENFTSWRGRFRQIDDILVMGIRI